LTKSPNIKKGIKNKTFKMKDKTIARTKKKADKPSADKASAEATKTVETVDHATDTDAEKTPEKSDEIEIDESDSEVEEIMEVDSPEETENDDANDNAVAKSVVPVTKPVAEHVVEIITETDEPVREYTTFYSDPEANPTMKHYAKLQRREGFKVVKMKGKENFTAWWDWLVDSTQYCGLNDICACMVRRAAEDTNKPLCGEPAEEWVVKKLISISVENMGYALQNDNPAQDWLMEAIQLAGMKVSAVTLQRLTNSFNLDKEKPKQKLLKEWEILTMQHLILGSKVSEPEIIDRFITFVNTNINDGELKNNMIKHKSEGVVRSIGIYYTWKDFHDRYSDDSAARETASIAPTVAAIVNERRPKRSRSDSSAGPNRNVRQRVPRNCCICDGAHPHADCPVRFSSGCWRCGSDAHIMRDCKVQVSRGDNKNSNRKRERNERTQHASAGVKTGDDHIIGAFSDAQIDNIVRAIEIRQKKQLEDAASHLICHGNFSMCSKYQLP
jgi:hypothetical protein